MLLSLGVCITKDDNNVVKPAGKIQSANKGTSKGPYEPDVVLKDDPAMDFW